ncbi:hypothetical protein PISMIDRAFT_8139 [Pisolithus microcarpus 441]|uniref:Uncharacterized protein n=1 Tax=Pisolithus microcarpus 441 TaxID=765257 RepID=A0A0C9YRT8_9AGAM|nr:hypothetical protein PISMIDRAFT_8139 [Pisolithus microcarpus 441]
MLGLLDMIVLMASLAISLAIMVPLVGAIVRFRANYNPKGLQLDPEGDVQPHTGPVISSFFAMLKRVYDIEGWLGLYKGLMPTLISSLIITVFLIVFLDDSSFRHRAYTAPSAGILGTLFYSIFAMLLSLPQTIITDRQAHLPPVLNRSPQFHFPGLLRPLTSSLGSTQYIPAAFYLLLQNAAAHGSSTLLPASSLPRSHIFPTSFLSCGPSVA